MTDTRLGLNTRFQKLVAKDVKASRQVRSPSPERRGINAGQPVFLALLAIAATAQGAIATTEHLYLAQGLIGKCAVVGENTFIYKRRDPDSPKVEGLSSEERVRLAGNGEDGWIAIDQPNAGFVRIADLNGFQECDGEPVSTPPIPPIQVPDLCRAAKQDIYIYRQRSTASLRIRQLPLNSQVTLAGTASDGWIAISSPERGFVQTESLKRCDRVSPAVAPRTTASELCRRVTYDGDEGLNIREQPSTDSVVVGRGFLGDLVTLKTLNPILDSNGREWVEITFPVAGWISNGFPSQGDINLQRCP